MINHRPLVFVDIETTGGRTDTSRIIDIGAIRVEDGKVVKKIDQMIQPGVPIPHFITKLTGITNDMVWNQPSFESIAPEIELIFKDALFVAHNVKFDYGFMKKEFKRIGVDFNMDRACTVKLSRLIHPEYHRHGLDKIIKRMNLSVQNRHRGFDDAEVLLKFFNAELQRSSREVFLCLNKATTRSRKINKTSNKQMSIF